MMNLQQALRYKSTELGCIINPKTEEEMIALSRAKTVIEVLQKYVVAVECEVTACDGRSDVRDI